MVPCCGWRLGLRLPFGASVRSGGWWLRDGDSASTQRCCCATHFRRSRSGKTTNNDAVDEGGDTVWRTKEERLWLVKSVACAGGDSTSVIVKPMFNAANAAAGGRARSCPHWELSQPYCLAARSQEPRIKMGSERHLETTRTRRRRRTGSDRQAIRLAQFCDGSLVEVEVAMRHNS